MQRGYHDKDVFSQERCSTAQEPPPVYCVYSALREVYSKMSTLPTLPKEVSHSSTTWHHQALLCICLEFGRPCLLVVLYSREFLNTLLVRSDIWPFLPSASPFQAFRGVVIVIDSDGLHKSCESSNKVQTTCLGAILTRMSHSIWGAFDCDVIHNCVEAIWIWEVIFPTPKANQTLSAETFRSQN